MRLFGRRQAAVESTSAASAVAARTAEAAAAAERVRLRTALDALGVGVVLADAHGNVQVQNAAVNRFSGHEAVLVKVAVTEVLASARRGREATRSVEFHGPPRRVLNIRSRPLADGFALATIDDVSERARLDSVRTDFVANISHELKTPVAALAVLAEALADSNDPDVIGHVSSRMVDEAHRAARTIDDLLELSRIELGGAAVREMVDVERVVTNAIERTATIADQRRIVVSDTTADVHGTAFGDSRQLVSALSNLIDNAVKYSDVGSAVAVRVDLRDGWVEIAVMDQGIGIPARDLDRVFERFYRVDQARSRMTGGTGLGLAIVRHVATNHGGEVVVQSEEGVGSTFTLRVPGANAEPAEADG